MYLVLRSAILVCLSAYCLLLPRISHAVVTRMVPLEIRETGQAYISDDNVYNRQVYAAIGAAAELSGLYDSQGDYVLQPGDTWTWEWEKRSTGEIVKTASTTYLGGEDHCWDDGSCGEFDLLIARWDERCQPEEDRYVMHLRFNGALVDSYGFRPTRFVPKVTDVLYQDSIEPRRFTSDEPQASDIGVVVRDDLDCGVFLQGVEVLLTSILNPGSNNHGHFSYGEIGTGRFESLGYGSELDPNTPETKGTEIEGLTDSDGFFQARYHAQDLAATDTIHRNL